MKLVLGIAVALVALVLPLAAQADPATKQTVDVTGLGRGASGPTTDVYGTASLVRTDNGISMTFRTSRTPRRRAGDDLVDHPRPDGHVVSAQFAAGHVVGGSGVATFVGPSRGRRHVGLLPPEFTEEVGCEGLTDARTQTVILLARFHGPAEPGRIPVQIHTPETAGISDIATQLCSPLACQYQAAIFPGA